MLSNLSHDFSNLDTYLLKSFTAPNRRFTYFTPTSWKLMHKLVPFLAIKPTLKMTM